MPLDRRKFIQRSLLTASIALSKPDAESHFLNCQVEHIEIAGMLQLGEFSADKIQVKRVHLV